MNLNRAVHEDIVVVEILPKEQWTCPSSIVTDHVTADESDQESNEVLDLLLTNLDAFQPAFLVEGCGQCMRTVLCYATVEGAHVRMHTMHTRTHASHAHTH